ncbi:mitochondrial ATP synthase g subunit-domain-containing protein [Lipomyces oligophaga]|uniref:mitochondrial ATP synthase g subunit-domain-containing protein n=1 Tax=Lipomyces oligophaga TaxID=45792 RepID=UPI0034CEFE3D
MLRNSFSPLRSLYSAGPISRSFVRQPRSIRQNSTLSSITARVNSVVNLSKGLIDKTVFYSKVLAEVGKQVYVKESFAPPTVPQVQALSKQLLTLFSKIPSISPATIVESFQFFTKKNVVLYTAYFIQIIGAFSLGEIIGRRKIVGY